MHLSALNRNIQIIAIAAIVLIVGIELATYAGAFTERPTPAQQQLRLPGLPDKTVEIAQSPVVNGSNTALMRILPIVVILGVLIFMVVVVLVVLQAGKMKKVNRDKIRIKDLNEISATLEQYFQQHGHYPMSATYDPQYYSAINILTEWSSYNFPPADEMRRFNSRWPLCDPSFNITNKEQIGNYLYYPHHFGQRFSLYAQLEAPSQKPVPDYGTIDKLPPTEADYNYRANGIDHHVTGQAAQPQPPVA